MADWDLIKKEYILGNSLSDLAKKHGVSYSTLKKRSARERWSADRKKSEQQAEKAIEEATQEIVRKSAGKNADCLDKIYRIADKLLDNIESGTECYERPNHIAMLTGALEQLKDIMRDVKGLQTLGEAQRYELAKEKLKIEKNKVGSGSVDDSGSGVVLLPNVKDHE